MIAKYKDKYFQCHKREDCVVLLSAEKLDGFRAIYKSDKRTLLRQEKVVSFEEIEELFEIEFQGKWKNRWFEMLIDTKAQTGQIIIWDNLETRRSLYGHPEAFAERHGFSVMVSDRNIPHAWDKTLNLTDFTGLRIISKHYLPEEIDNIQKVTIKEILELYQSFVLDTEYIMV